MAQSSAIKRICRDLEKFSESNFPGIWIDVDEEDVTKMKAIIVGPDDTAYEGAFMYFNLDFPHDYPFKPPKVTHLTHQTKNARLHPNLYGGEGKVCLSILGTWSGPGWTMAMGLTTVLLSIQALLDKEPLRHEPGFESGRDACVESFNRATEYNALDIGVCEMMKRTDIPDELKEKMEEHFKNNTEKYILRTKLLQEKYPDSTSVHHNYHATNTNFQLLYEQMKSLAHNESESEQTKSLEDEQKEKDEESGGYQGF